MEITLLLSLWGATLSTALAVLIILDRARARPIIRAYAKLQSRNAQEDAQFVTALVKTSPYGHTETMEFYVEFRVENHGTKPLSLRQIYIEDGPDNLLYISPPGLPLVLEGQSSATFEIQKEYFDDADLITRERRNADVREIGFVDALDRRYAVSKKQLREILGRTVVLPTTRAVFQGKEHPEDRVIAFKAVHPAIIMRRSKKPLRLREQLRHRLLSWRK
ncbi:MAG: hypothetical protein QOF41_3251 [Methylobacteriaceae bacterium]|nr:hypothetical protein [Methylobacteriaceae bacterium]